MPKLTDTYVTKLPAAETGTKKFWDSEIKGFVLFVGKRSKTWYFQKDVGGQTKRILIGVIPSFQLWLHVRRRLVSRLICREALANKSR